MDLTSSTSIQELLMNNHSSLIKPTVTTPSIHDLELQLLEASKSGDLEVVKVNYYG